MTRIFFKIEKETKENASYRRVMYTGKMQLVYMSLKPGEIITREAHPVTDQFFRVEQGIATFNLNGTNIKARDGDAIIIPAGTFHSISNESKTIPLKMYTIYTPPQHPPGTWQRTKPKKEED